MQPSRSRATARAEKVVLLGGLVTARVVERSAVAADGKVTYAGAVTGLVVAGETVGDGGERASDRDAVGHVAPRRRAHAIVRIAERPELVL